MCLHEVTSLLSLKSCPTRAASGPATVPWHTSSSSAHPTCPVASPRLWLKAERSENTISIARPTTWIVIVLLTSSVHATTGRSRTRYGEHRHRGGRLTDLRRCRVDVRCRIWQQYAQLGRQPARCRVHVEASEATPIGGRTGSCATTSRTTTTTINRIDSVVKAGRCAPLSLTVTTSRQRVVMGVQMEPTGFHAAGRW